MDMESIPEPSADSCCCMTIEKKQVNVGVHSHARKRKYVD